MKYMLVYVSILLLVSDVRVAVTPRSQASLSKRAQSTTLTSLRSTRCCRKRSLTAGRSSGINSLPEGEEALQNETATGPVPLWRPMACI